MLYNDVIELDGRGVEMDSCDLPCRLCFGIWNDFEQRIIARGMSIAIYSQMQAYQEVQSRNSGYPDPEDVGDGVAFWWWVEQLTSDTEVYCDETPAHLGASQDTKTRETRQ